MNATPAPSAAAHALKSAHRVVLKVGSAILTDGAAVRATWLASLGADIAAMRAAGQDVLVVTSGAIALGRADMALGSKLRLEEKQAASAAGQIALAEAWRTALGDAELKVAQVLLTLEDNDARKRYLNARATLRTLMEWGVIPLVNENDTVATSEIRYGDNDRLAAHAAQLVGADLLVILSDVDGLYTADPHSDQAARHIDALDGVTAAHEAMATGPNVQAGVGAGGMATKLAAAKIAGSGGCATIIAPGRHDQPIKSVLSGGRATLIRATGTPDTARRQWIAGRLTPAGAITIDQGAEKAVRGGASILPAGVTGVTGDFTRGDAIELRDGHDKKIGQGLSTYDADVLRTLIGKTSADIEAVLGYRRRPAVIERDDLVLSEPTSEDGRHG